MMGEPAASMINLGPVSTEEVSVSDKMIGLSEYNSEYVRCKNILH